MANNNVFSCDAGTFSIDQAIQGQTPLAMYDSLKQAAYLPEIRQLRSGKGAQVIMPYDTKSPEALWSQMQAAFKQENRTVESHGVTKKVIININRECHCHRITTTTSSLIIASCLYSTCDLA